MYKNGFTEGQHIFNIKYNLDNLSNKAKIIKVALFCFIKFIFPYLLAKLETFLLNYISSNDSNQENASYKSRLVNFFVNFTNKIQRFSKLIYSILNLANFLAFIGSNKFPYLINRIFGFEYVFLNELLIFRLKSQKTRVLLSALIFSLKKLYGMN